MENYTSNISAARYWGIKYLNVFYGSSAQDVDSQSDTMHITYTCKKKMEHSKLIVSHLNTSKLPAGSLVKCGSEYIASPQLLFLELAATDDFLKTTLFGLTICGCDKDTDLRAHTNSLDLKRYIAKTHGLRGHETACRAAKYIRDGSASIMESLLYMFLTLPHKYGGYGLCGAEFNHKINLPYGKRAIGKSYIYADLFWGASRLVVEYDSDTWHAEKNSWINDAQREVAIERMGYKVIRINTSQIYSSRALDEAAKVIAKALGKRIRNRAKDYDSFNNQIHRLLPRRSEHYTEGNDSLW